MLTFAIVLLIVGVLLALMEAIIPSFGALGVGSAIALIAAVVIAFRHNEDTGFAFIGILVVAMPVVILGGLKLFPHTPVGRRVILKPAVEKPNQRGDAGVAQDDYSFLLGKKGIAVTELRPSGIAEIEGKRYSVVAQGELIADKSPIEVVEVEGNSIVVETTTNDA